MKKLSLSTLFLLCALLAVSCSTPKKESSTLPKKGQVIAYVTTNDRTHDLTKQTFKLSTSNDKATLHIQLNPDMRYQSMDGFGAAVTGSTCFNLLQMEEADRKRFLEETFSETKGFGHSYVRISIGCSDFSLSEYTCCDKPGIENFALQEEELNYVIPILKEILAIQPTLRILGSPWTCPRWMKVNNLKDLQPFESWTSGQLNPVFYQDYATYFVKWIEAMEEKGIPIYAITPQNEPLNRGNSASLFMGWEEQRDFVKTALGPQLKAAGLKAKLYLFDHNYNYDRMEDQNDYPLRIYEDREAAAFATGSAYHNYGGNKDELLDIQTHAPDKELIFTETSIGTWNDGQNIEKRLIDDMREVALGTVNNWCKAVIVWNLMLDSERGPNRDGGCQTCYGAVDINRDDFKTITRNSHYYLISHLSTVVKPGAVRIGTKESPAEGLIYAAFINPDGSYAFVVLNESDGEKTIHVGDAKKQFNHTIPAKAVASYRWHQ